MDVQPDLPLMDRMKPDAHMSFGAWAGSALAVSVVFAALAFSFFDGPLDQRILRHAPPGVASMTVADTLFTGPMVEGRSVSTCNKAAIQNLTTALIDSNQFAQAAAELKTVGARCATFQ